MDSGTALVVASIMALLNGGVLGLMHLSLMPGVRSSARDWRVGTLLFAASGILLAANDAFLPAFILPVAYGLSFFGASLYWRANLKFCGKRASWWIFAPAAIGIAAVYLLVLTMRMSDLRVALSGLIVASLLLASGLALRARDPGETLHAPRLLVLLSYTVFGLMLFRAVFFAASAAVPEWSFHPRWIDAAGVMAIAVFPVVGTTIFLLMCLERSGEVLRRAADTDELTGVPNRRTISRDGELGFARAREQGRDFAIVVIDIDYFKQINDRHGHGVGDLALCHIASLFGALCAPPHLFGRQGGEEFVALFDDADAEAARACAESMRVSLHSNPFQFNGVALALRASFGVAAIDRADEDYDHLLRRADAALYAAKLNGRDRVEVSATTSANR
jgi:diguanylate cyclase (GGDEF)-like protein